jgi:hypothetical protein
MGPHNNCLGSRAHFYSTYIPFESGNHAFNPRISLSTLQPPASILSVCFRCVAREYFDKFFEWNDELSSTHSPGHLTLIAMIPKLFYHLYTDRSSVFCMPVSSNIASKGCGNF